MENTKFSLSNGAVEAICRGDIVDKPIFLVDGIKKMQNGDKEKIRLSINDGNQTFSCVMLAPKYNDLVNSDELTNGSVFRTEKYLTKKQGNKTIILLTEITQLDSNDLEQKSINTPTSEVTASSLPIVSTVPLSNRPVVQSAMTANRVPIQFINAYMNNWVINGRVVSKTQMKTWSKPSGDGKLFSFEMADETCDIRITAFNKEADKFYDLIEQNKAYSLTKANVKSSNRTFNRTKCDYELVLNENSEIREIVGNDDIIPMVKYNFVEIAKLRECQEQSHVDVVGVAHEIRDTTSVMSKTTNTELQKRDIILVDRSLNAVSVTLWRDKTTLVDNLENPTMIIKGATVSSFNGVSLNSNDSLIINSTSVPEAVSLAGWYNEEGRHQTFQMVGSGMGIGAASGSGGSGKISFLSELSSVQNTERGDYCTVIAEVTQIKQRNMVYKACTSEGCNKKLEETGNGQFYCNKCEKSIDDYKYRMLLSIKIADFTDAKWITVFQEVGETILGCSSQDIGRHEECQNESAIDEIVKNSLFERFIIKVRSKMETFQDESRLKVVAVSAEPLNLITDISRLLSNLST